MQGQFRITHQWPRLENSQGAEWKNFITDLRLILTFLHSFVPPVRLLKHRH